MAFFDIDRILNSAEIKKELHLEERFVVFCFLFFFFQELFWGGRKNCQIQERLRSVISWLCSRIYKSPLDRKYGIMLSGKKSESHSTM